MAWSWHFTPTRLMRDPRFLRLDDPEAGLLLRLYACADRWGRGPLDPDAFAVVAGCLRGIPDFDGRIGRLVDSGLIRVSEDGTAWEIDRHDDDAPRDVLRNRPASEYPECTQTQRNGLPAKPGKTGQCPEKPGKTGQNPPRQAGRQAGRHRDGAPKGAPVSQPQPAAATDARAHGGPVLVAPPPALGARGAQPEAPAPEVPKPVPRRDIAEVRGPAPKRADFASVEGYERARQSWLGEGVDA